MEDVDLGTEAEIDAKRGTSDPLDEGALAAARPARVEIPASHVSNKVAKYCEWPSSSVRPWAQAQKAQAAALRCRRCRTDARHACSRGGSQTSSARPQTGGARGRWPSATRR